MKQRITPCLWFDGQAEEAANFDVSIFGNSRITTIAHYGDAGAGPKDGVMVVGFELDGQGFTGLNGGPMFKFNEAISMIVNCETQDEVDHYWDRLGEGGEPGRCGWFKDRFGVSGQIVPTVVVEMVQDTHSAKSQRVMATMMKMRKLEIAALKQAYDA